MVLFFYCFFCYNYFKIDGDFMNKKGFTLIELMAVITILVILSLIIIPIVDKNVKRSKDDMYKIQIENIRMAGLGYFSDNVSSRPGIGSFCSISISTLVSQGYISDDVVNPKTGESFGNIYVQIKNTGTSSRNVYSYLVCPIESDCESTNPSCM